MASGGTSEADRLRLARLVFERSQRDRISMADARDALARERWAESDRRLAARCGTQAPARTTDLPQQWWQRD
jgi:hypothetical protein